MLVEQARQQPDDAPFSDDDIERRTKLVHLEPDDLARLVAASTFISLRAEYYVSVFFDYLAGIEEAAALFAKPDLLESASI